VIVLDAAAVPDFFSGARTRLRGLIGAYGRLQEAPPLVVRIGRGATLLDGVELGHVRVEEVPRPGGPLRRVLTPRLRTAPDGPLVRAAKLWHSEAIPPLQPRGVPAMLTIHDLRWSESRSATGAPWAQWFPRHVAATLWLPSLARALAGVVTVSSASARRIRERLRVPAERVHVIPNAVDVDPAPRLAATDESALLDRLGVASRPFLLAVGHLEPRKGIELVLAALARTPSHGALARAALVLVGAGRGESALRARVAALGIADRVVFAGSLDERSTSSLYARAAALVFPSRYEGFGFPIHEARALGCPVVARRLEVLAELAEPAGAGDSGVTFLADEADAWVDKLNACVDVERPPRSVPAKRGATWDEAARRLAELYRSTRSSGAPPR